VARQTENGLMPGFRNVG